VIEGEVMETSPITGKALKDAGFPDGVAIGAIIHEGRVLLPDPELIIRQGDRIILLAEKSTLKDVEAIFRVSAEYF